MTNNIQEVTITVDGGYSPSTISLKQGQPAVLKFIRQSTKGCLEVVKSDDLGFEKDLPIGEVVKIDIPTDQAGIYRFSCGMDMVSGEVEVV
ncbi:cupredoxin domain-containing protein [Lactiplantibacillus herbarum]|uniref:cupredoxin domain-containing protein n=1 Tax=Lactiplantibacillus herbarum TaxID=1670446 RepID=UPI00064F52D1|nr:cupredoxin domain-containing protein [Lactiplantibacillus herbarum]